MVQSIITSAQFDELFENNVPLMDVRAPIEFTKGAFPDSTNLPLMIDSEREQVGTCYKQHGQNAAIALGHSLVNGETKQARVGAWLNFFQINPNACLYCFRGGLRSQLTQTWLKEAGVDLPYIQGGYKALRQHLIEKLERPAQSNMLILSGITGSGKTDFLLKRPEAVDLEGAANHRGSSFGRHVSGQPSQINFENRVATELIKHQGRNVSNLLLEDESYLIGRSAIPKSFYTQMQNANILVLEEQEQTRLQRLLEEYVHKMHREYVEEDGEELGFTNFSHYLAQSVTAIKKRLGGKQHDELQSMITTALEYQAKHDDTSVHLEWIGTLLHKYYDPMYQYQLSKKQGKIIFSGDHQAMHQWLDDQPLRTNVR